MTTQEKLKVCKKVLNLLQKGDDSDYFLCHQFEKCKANIEDFPEVMKYRPKGHYKNVWWPCFVEGYEVLQYKERKDIRLRVMEAVIQELEATQ
jgi:hypothetical protein